MKPNITAEVGFSYLGWLSGAPDSLTCAAPRLVGETWPSNEGALFMKSVPEKHRRRYLWGWKHPGSMYRLHLYVKIFPNMLFVHILRDPLDMASTPFEHLSNRVREFTSLHGGLEQSARVMRERCATAVVVVAPDEGHSRDTAVSRAGREAAAGCTLSAEALGAMINITWPSKRPSVPWALQRGWSCMEMMLWAEMNHAVAVFAERCLSETTYLRWHSEDDYGLRGAAEQERLMARIAAATSRPLEEVRSAMLPPGKPTKEEPPVRRRLGYGKYRDVPDMDVAESHRCAESALPGALRLFGYQGTGEDARKGPFPR